MCFTSPPYFNTEKYSDEDTQSYIRLKGATISTDSIYSGYTDSDGIGNNADADIDGDAGADAGVDVGAGVNVGAGGDAEADVDLTMILTPRGQTC